MQHLAATHRLLGKKLPVMCIASRLWRGKHPEPEARRLWEKPGETSNAVQHKPCLARRAADGLGHRHLRSETCHTSAAARLFLKRNQGQSIELRPTSRMPRREIAMPRRFGKLTSLF